MPAFVKQTGRPGCTYKLVDRLNPQKVVASATADANGLVTIAGGVPAGHWMEQISYTITDSGQAKTVNQQSVSPLDFEAVQAAHGPVVNSPDGSVWQITVSNAGVVGATKLA